MLSRLSSRASAMARVATGSQARALNVHEYVSKQLLRDFGVPTEFGIMCQTLPEVEAAFAKIKSTKIVVKSQILAGGRGKGTFEDGYKGGVHVCDGPEAAMKCAKSMLNNKLVTKQTAGKGVQVRKLYVTEAISNIKRELYIAMVLDRKDTCPCFIGYAEGGMGIEELAMKFPEKIMRLPINVQNGMDEAAALKFATSLGFSGATAPKVVESLKNMYNMAKSKDCTMVEINPFVELEDGNVMCLDAKLGFDDNAEFRHADIWAQADNSEKDPKEIAASAAELNYIALEGNVGCMVNGAGLAMATMDVISMFGGHPANFLDVGGSAAAGSIVKAFEIITMDPHVKCIFVNIFGGIMKCDMIATGVVQACKELGDKLTIPIVIRLNGTNDVLGHKILSASGLKIHTRMLLDEAAKLAVKLASEAK